MSQVLDTDKSLQNAVSRIIAWLAEAGEAIPSSDTGGYSKVRKRLGAVTIGDAWRFGRLDSQQQQITQDIALYPVPDDLEELMQVLVGIVEH